jgi:hypothetical protein
MSHNSDKASFRQGITDFAAQPLNSRQSILPAVAGQQEFLESMLSGSQKKTAYALRLNAEAMIRDGGLNSAAFLTLTLGDLDEDGKFQGISDAAEASRRINNLNRRVLADLFEKAIVVTERHASGKIHFHILGILSGRPDIRTNFDFEGFKTARTARAKGYVHQAAEIRYKMAASDALRARWELLRDVLPRYGFGRAQLTPIEKTGGAVACYISKYIEKNVCNRLAQDKRKKLVRYIGWEKCQLKANEFEWNGKRAEAWRGKARQLVGLLGLSLPDADFKIPAHVTLFCFQSLGKIRQKMMDGTQARAVLGSRWAWRVHKLIQTVSDEAVPFMVWDFPMQQVVKRELYHYADRRQLHLINLPKNHDVFLRGERFTPAEFAELTNVGKN